MAGEILASATGHKATAMECLIGGVGHKITEGKMLINGIAKTLVISKKYTVTWTIPDSSYARSEGTLIIGTTGYDYSGSATVDEQTSIKVGVMAMNQQYDKYATITFNGVEVVGSGGGSYTFALSANTTIVFSGTDWYQHAEITTS